MVDGLGVIEEPQIETANQFALEIDHMSRCIQRDRDVDLLTRGEEGCRISGSLRRFMNRQGPGGR
jgi:hypothetical protein